MILVKKKSLEIRDTVDHNLIVEVEHQILTVTVKGGLFKGKGSAYLEIGKNEANQLILFLTEYVNS